MDNLALACRCGTISGRAIKVYPHHGTRVVCYCKDCQSFAQAIAAAQATLDAYGGTDIYQLPAARVQIHRGLEQVRCLRLSEKGLYRWYAGCCNTPIANTLAPRMPLVGLIHTFISDPAAEDKTGPVCARVNLAGATGDIPRDLVRSAPAKGYVRKLLFKILQWKLSGQSRPNPFFTGNQPICMPEIHTETRDQ